MVHSRFATNTSLHGVLHSLLDIWHITGNKYRSGNLNWLKSSQKTFTSPYFTAQEVDMLLPLVTPDQSDSAYLDNMVEMLVHAGRSLPHVMMMLIPEAWDGNEIMEDYKNISMSSMPV